MILPTGWKVALISDPMAGGRRLLIFRPIGNDAVELVTGYTPDGNPIVDRLEPATTSDFRGFLIADDALDHLAETLKPGPASGELGRLEDALAIERGRVDRVLAHLLDGQEHTPT